MAPVIQLPDALLSGIFMFYAEECRSTFDATDDYRVYKHHPYIWIAVTHVCRRWRDAGLRFPPLWNWIVPLRPDTTEAFIQRSGQLPLTIPRLERNLYPLTPKVKRSYQLLYAQFHRVRSIELATDCPAPKPYPRHAPLLQSISIAPLYGEHLSQRLLSFLSKLKPPSLQCLTCRFNSVETRALIGRTVTDLTLGAFEFERSTDAEILVSLLARLPCLETFQILRVDKLWPVDEDSQVPPSLPEHPRKVSLPKLRSLTITDKSGRSAIHLLSHLVLPDTVNISILSNNSSQPDVMAALPAHMGNLGGVQRSLSMAIEPAGMWPFELEGFGYAIIGAFGCPINLRVWDTEADDTSLTPCGAPRIRYRTLSKTVARLGINALADRVTTLYLGGFWIKFTSEEWHSTFKDMGALRHLQLRGDSLQYLPDALMPPPIAGQSVDRNRDTLFPSLVSLRIVEADRYENPSSAPKESRSLSDWLSCLSTALRERHSLEQLTIEGGTALTEKDIDNFRKQNNVSVVCWNGVNFTQIVQSR